MDSNLLLECRKYIALDSLPRSKLRLEKEKNSTIASVNTFTPIGSMFCDARLPMGVSIDHASNVIAIAGWSNEGSLWSVEGSLIKKLEGHTDKVQCIDTSQGKTLTGSFDCEIRLWGSSSSVYKGHYSRINNVKWHPSLKYFISCSHDMTWKLWDVECCSSIITQDGHNRGVYTLSLHPDGNLLFSGDLAGVGALWDLRTGKVILTMTSHLKQILASCFASNGYVLVTGSDDNTLKVWDIRRKGLLYTIPAHSKLVSGIDINGNCIASSSYDGYLKIWKLEDFSLAQSINHDSKITDVAFDGTGDTLVSTSFDRTFKIWDKS
jgi:U4/U6 small nuclear ribonucleoprotein PRP4